MWLTIGYAAFAIACMYLGGTWFGEPGVGWGLFIGIIAYPLPAAWYCFRRERRNRR